MTTPILDFVRRYAESQALRLHMPGHKGINRLGAEAYDITEIDGADSLYEADGIIRESEKNAGALFGAETFFSTEGSSLCIRAMLYLACRQAREKNPHARPLIAAGRNAHKTFLSAAALLDFDILWLYPNEADSYLSCKIDAPTLEKTLSSAEQLPAAVYLTSPDYLGNTVDLAAIAAVCRRFDVLLLVDNAHGAYLKFLKESRHPMDLGVDLCCDSAHKTLPVLTGGAYLHIAFRHENFAAQAKSALALFGSTSPSYLILQSLDAANAYLFDGYREKLQLFTEALQLCKARLTAAGFVLCEDEPLKITIDAKQYGYYGTALAAILQQKGLVSEFADPDFLVLMLTPEIDVTGMERLEQALCAIPAREVIFEKAPVFRKPYRRLSVRDAVMSPCEVIPAAESAGRILAAASVGCPPAVPIVVSGERIDEDAVRCFAYYGIQTCTVVKEKNVR